MRQSLLWDRLLERFPKEHPAAVSQQNHNRAKHRKPARSGHPPTCQGDGDVRINTKKQPTPPGKTETRSGSRVHGGSFGQGSLSTRKPNRQMGPYHAYHAYHAPFPSAFWGSVPTKEPPYHAYHAYHAPFPSAFWGLPLPKNLLTTHTTHITHHFRRPFGVCPYQRTSLPRIPRISRTISVVLLGSVPTKEPPYHAYHAYHAPFPSAFWGSVPTKEPRYHAYHAYHAPFPSAAGHYGAEGKLELVRLVSLRAIYPKHPSRAAQRPRFF